MLLCVRCCSAGEAALANDSKVSMFTVKSGVCVVRYVLVLLLIRCAVVYALMTLFTSKET